jgi:hypothetical protein
MGGITQWAVKWFGGGYLNSGVFAFCLAEGKLGVGKSVPSSLRYAGQAK